MRANDFLTENQHREIQQLQEGPLGSLVKAAGTGLGKVAGGVAKGVGAVAGGLAGMGSAFKKGFQSGKKTVSGEEEPETAATPAASTAPANAATTTGTTATTATAPTAEPKASAEPATTPAVNTPTPAAKPAAATAPTAEPSAAAAPESEPIEKSSDYKKALDAATKLSPEQKKEVISLLQADPKVAAAVTRQTTKKTEKPKTGTAPKSSANPATQAAPSTDTRNWDERTGAPISAKAKAEYEKFTPEKKAEIEKNIADEKSKAPTGIAKKTPKKKVSPSQAQIDADRERLMGPTSDSKIDPRPSITENFSLFRK